MSLLINARASCPLILPSPASSPEKVSWGWGSGGPAGTTPTGTKHVTSPVGVLFLTEATAIIGMPPMLAPDALTEGLFRGGKKEILGWRGSWWPIRVSGIAAVPGETPGRLCSGIAAVPAERPGRLCRVSGPVSPERARPASWNFDSGEGVGQAASTAGAGENSHVERARPTSWNFDFGGVWEAGSTAGAERMHCFGFRRRCSRNVGCVNSRPRGACA